MYVLYIIPAARMKGDIGKKIKLLAYVNADS